MTHVDSEGAVVLGVGPRAHLSEGTVTVAVTMARRLGVGIEVVHVVPSTVGGPTGRWQPSGSLDRLGVSCREDLNEAVQRVRERMDGEQPVSGELLRGGVIATLVDRSARAQMVIIGHRRLGKWDRLRSGSVAAGVAARAHVPVVSVPASWQAAHDIGPVMIAIDGAVLTGAEIRAAVGVTALSDVPRVTLRVSHLPPVDKDILGQEARQLDLLLAARHDVARDANLPTSVTAVVPCTFEVRWGHLAKVLVDATQRSSMLVVARRKPTLPLSSRLGPVARAVLRDAACPVMVVEPQ